MPSSNISSKLENVMNMLKDKKIIPAIIAKSQEELNGLLKKVIDIVEIAQLDVMDNEFVPNNSLNFDFKLPDTTCLFEAHLMIKNPKTWIKRNYWKVDTILVHYESVSDPEIAS